MSVKDRKLREEQGCGDRVYDENRSAVGRYKGVNPPPAAGPRAGPATMRQETSSMRRHNAKREPPLSDAGENFESTNSCARNPSADFSTNIFASNVESPRWAAISSSPASNLKITFSECGAFPTHHLARDRPISLARSRRAPRPQSDVSHSPSPMRARRFPHLRLSQLTSRAWSAHLRRERAPQRLSASFPPCTSVASSTQLH